MPEKEKKAPLCTPLHLLAACLGIICIILVSLIITLHFQFHTAMTEQLRENSNLTAQTVQLMSERDDMQRQTRELTREMDGLNWTLGVIMKYKSFPVDTFCPQKVCKPCRDDWVLFQSSCYLFTKLVHSSDWKRWAESREECQKLNADLVVIESEEEQKFINGHTEKYNDDNHGYWIGLSKNAGTKTWRWFDGRNLTAEYWRKEQSSSSYECAVTSPHGVPPANWKKASCYMMNRHICETRALTKQEEEPSDFT
ncbi:CD209 antigen-like protein D isoform X2 [Xyrichtys novacula]|nr:CD209 antigen-like protein D isoform X2 [Xyrichtys novacula]